MKWLPFAVAALFLGTAFLVDFDGDGWLTWQEAANGSPFLNGDGDEDGLPDGWEDARGINPFHWDSDGDGLGDGAEVEIGADPTKMDTDHDGVPDGQELGDCEGRPMVLFSDSDHDFLLDNSDAEQCNSDQDRDGILDGNERNVACVSLADCDFDGLPDGLELQDYDSLKADSFGVGIPDGVSYLFAEAGQAPSGDQDQDGIPDDWERTDGLIAWGDFDPQPGRADLLIEFVRVEGPNSKQFDGSFFDAYEDVASMFSSQGIHVQWVETTVAVPTEPFLSFLEPEDQAQFLQVVAEASASENPYVTSVLMMPQQQQPDGLVLGAAHLRSMLAVVDYGSFVTVQFDDGSSVSPVLESHMRSDNQEALAAYDTVSYSVGDTFRLTTTTLEVTWTPYWFGNGITVDGNFAAITGMTLNTPGLASTIAHELGHTLGLCHAHERDCYEFFTPAEVRARDQSTMSYFSGNALYFLPSEWQTAKQFLACPPEDPLAALASGSDVLEAKYSFEGEVIRGCGEFLERTENLTPQEGNIASYFAGPDRPPRGGTGWFVLYVLVGIGAVIGSVFVSRGTSTSDSEDN